MRLTEVIALLRETVERWTVNPPAVVTKADLAHMERVKDQHVANLSGVTFVNPNSLGDEWDGEPAIEHEPPLPDLEIPNSLGDEWDGEPAIEHEPPLPDLEIPPMTKEDVNRAVNSNYSKRDRA